MKAYIIAIVDGDLMAPVYDKIFKTKNSAQKKCDELNAQFTKAGKRVVLCANNWHKEEAE